MKFGVLVTREMIEHGSSDPYRKIYDFLLEMEDLGYDLAYVGQHRFSPATSFSEPSAPLVMLSAMLARTRRMKMCTNILLLSAHHPLEVAEQVTTLNELCANRFVLGAAIGYRPYEFETVGWPFRTRARRFEEGVEILRRAFSGEEFSFKGEFYDIPPCRLMPPPPAGPPAPIWIGAVSEPAMLRAGRIGDGWLIGFAEHLMELQGKVARYKAVAAEHGRPATLCLMRDLHIAPTRAQLNPDWLANSMQVWRSYQAAGAEPDRDELSKDVMLGGKSVSLDDFVPNRAVVGDPQDCIAEMQRIKDLIDPEYVLFTPVGVPDPDQQIRELRLFGKEVLPAFRTAD
jgi:alkanesulfonate monooxygenase SsuD/methylene tetrahydromethanopterin reductase-like flavin-dependent oxidoreductase (luciferase family)